MSLSQVCAPFLMGLHARAMNVRLSRGEIHFCNQHSQASVSVCCVGSEAYRIWQHSQAGQVLAVFRRSFYVQSDEGVICIGLPSIAKGPIHVLLESDSDRLFESVTRGQYVIFDDVPQFHSDTSNEGVSQPFSVIGCKLFTGKIEVNTSFRFLPWHREVLTGCAVLSIAEYGFGWLLKEHVWRGEQGMELPDDGLDAVDSGLRRYVFSALNALYNWLSDSVRTLENRYSGESGNELTISDEHVRSVSGASLFDIQKLLGAGPGLTPAGDDLLAGVMLALHLVNRADLALSIWQTLEPWLVRRTNTISSAHLLLASQGQCSESMMLLLEQLTNANTQDSPENIQGISRNVQALANRMGASSGWDTLAGVSLVMRACQTRPYRSVD